MQRNTLLLLISFIFLPAAAYGDALEAPKTITVKVRYSESPCNSVFICSGKCPQLPDNLVRGEKADVYKRPQENEWPYALISRDATVLEFPTEKQAVEESEKSGVCEIDIRLSVEEKEFQVLQKAIARSERLIVVNSKYRGYFGDNR